MRVLVATDGSEHARTAVDWLARFPLPSATAVLVVAAADVPRPVVAARPLPAYELAVIEMAREAAKDARAVLARRWADVEMRVPGGDPRAVVPQNADEWGADLVVVGARGHGVLAGALLGSVSTAIVHAAPCPVLVVKGQPRPLRRVLLAVDGSDEALSAVRFFAGLALDPAMTVELIGVVERPRFPHTAPAFMTPVLMDAVSGLVAERRARMTEALDRGAVMLERRVSTVERLMPVGLPADEIVGVTKQGPIDLVVVGARGLGAIKRLVLGSVSERVLHEAPCPVLVVKRGSP